MEYRRVGTGGGFPQTFEDVAHAVDALPADLARRVVVVGHSAGGHLAGWAAGRTARTPGGAPHVALTGVISLSGLLDLTAAALSPESAGPGPAADGRLAGTACRVATRWRTRRCWSPPRAR